MSIEYLNLAFKAKVDQSTTKFLLVSLADYANEIGEAYPSIATLEDKTAQNRKTIINGLQKLVDLGYISDTGERRGRTKQVKVWQLSLKTAKETVPKTEPLDDSGNDPENGTVNGDDNSTENGTVKESQKRNSSKNGTVPFLPSNSTENGTVKGSQKRYTDPSVLLTISNPTDTVRAEVLKNADPDHQLTDAELIACKPDEVHAALWESFIKLRKRRKAEVTVRATIALLKSLITCVHHGVTMNDMLQTCLEKGWKGVNVEWYLNFHNITPDNASKKQEPALSQEEKERRERELHDAELEAQWQHDVNLNKLLVEQGKKPVLPRENKHLERFARHHSLPGPNPGENYPTYRARLSELIERQSQQEVA